MKYIFKISPKWDTSGRFINEGTVAMRVPPSPHLAAAVITSWGILGAIIDPVGEGTLAGNQTEFFWKPKISPKSGGYLLIKTATATLWGEGNMWLLCKVIKEKKSSLKLLEQSMTLPNAEWNDSQQEFLAEITFLCLLQSYYRTAILQDCCVLLQTWKHTPKSALPSGICTGFSAPRLQEDRKHVIPFSPKVDSFTFKWCFSPKLISATSNHFTPSTTGLSFLPAHSSEEAPFPRNKNTHVTHRHLCKRLTQNHFRTPDFHPCPEMEPASYQLPQGYITPHVSLLVP